MKKIIWTGLLSLFVLVGCNNEDSFNSLIENVELEASIENSKSRVAFDSDGKFYWTINDAFGVTTTQSKTTFSKMTMDEGGAGKATATFTGKYMPGLPEGYAVYPYNKNHSMEGTELTYHFPESYDYTIEDHDYFVSDGTGNSFNPPMWSSLSGGKANFKHLGGVLCIKIVDLPAGQNQQLRLIASNQITGDFITDLAASSPVLTTQASSENNVVTINYTNTEESTRVFYVPVPTGTYSKLTVEFEAEGETVSVPFDNKVVNARSLKIMQIGTESIEGGEDNAEEVEEVDDVKAILDASTDEEELAVKVTGEVTGTDNTITIPATMQTKTTTFTFAEVAADAKITITEETENSYTGVIIIEVPEGTATSQIEAYVPNGEVYIKQGSVTSLLVSSKDETTIIGAGVEVGTLTVKKGNVRIEDGGKVTTINRSEDNEDDVTYVIYEAATAPAIVLGENQPIVLVSAGEWDLRKAIADANTSSYQLENDIVLVEPLTIPDGKTFTLDLNGKTIRQEKECTKSYEMIANNGTLTITGNGKISFKDTGAGDPAFGWGSYTIRNSGNLTVENGTIEHLGEQDFATHMICAIFQYSGSTIIKDGTISTPAYRSARLWKGNMTIEGGTFDGQLWVQSVDDSAELTIKDGTFGPNGRDGSSVFVGNVTASSVHHTVKFNVTGGYFETKIGCNDTEKLTGNLVTGGIFTESAKTNTNGNLLAAGYEFEENEDGTYTPVYDVSKAVVTSSDELNAALANNEITTIQLGADLTLSNILEINRAVTLDGNSKTLKSTAGRAINVTGVAEGEVIIKNLTIIASGERAINIIQNSKKVTIQDVNATAANYTVNVASSAPAALVAISGSTLSGLNVVNVQSPSTVVTVSESTINCNDNNTIVGESYAALCLGKDATEGKITATDCTINVTEGSDSVSGRNDAEDGMVTINGSTEGIQINVAYVQQGDYYYAYPTLAAAFEQESLNGETVVLKRDIVLSETLTIPAGKTFTLDLNGKTISQEKAQTDTYAMLINKGTLVIKDSATGGKITYKDITQYTADVNYASNTIRNEGTLTLKSGTIENTSADDVMDHGYPHAIDVYQGSTTNIEGGTVKSENYDCIRMFCNSTTLATTVNISGGNIINCVTFQNPGSNTAGYGVLNITGGTFASTTGKVNVRLLNFSTDVSNMKATISDGTFDVGVGISNYCSWTSNWDWLTIENNAINKVE